MASKIVVSLDTSVNNTISAQCKQNDDLTLEASIFENGIEKDLTNCFVIINGRKADLTPVIQDEYIIKEGNKLYVQLNKDFTRVPGVTLIEVVTVEEGKQNTTYNFVLVVDSSVIRSSLESGPNITALERLVDTVIEAKEVNEEAKELTKEVKELNEETKQLIPEAKKSKEDLIVLIPEATPMINALKELIPEAGELNDSIKERMEEYEANEEIRKESETDRNVSESNRNTKETERITNENLRVNKETERINSEKTRKSQEEDRKTKETERIANERTRGDAETSRNNNENLRKIAEENRVNNEDARKIKENERIVAETNRTDAEENRVLAEETRADNEAERQLKEQDRLNSEEERKTNEIARQTAYEEITEAREDYFGEGHNDLEERLNSDFDNIHQRVNESSLLPYEGTTITANDSYYGLIKDTVIKGRTLQNLAINPTLSPGISDLGSNTYDMPYNVVNLYGVSFLKNKSMIKPSTVYTFCINILKNDIDTTNTTSIKIQIGSEQAYFNIYKGVTGVVIGKITTPEYLTIGFGVAVRTEGATSGSVKFKDFIALEGDYTNTPLSDLPYIEGIKSVGEQEVTEDRKYKVSVKSCGKNLFDGKMELGVINATTGLNTDSTSNIRCVNYIKVKKNTDYIITRDITGSTMPIRFYYANKVFDSSKLATIESGKTTVKFNTGNSLFIRFMQWNYTDLNMQIQLEEGTIATEHEPYKETTQEYLLDEPLRGIPNSIRDYIDNNGKYVRKINKTIITGNENWEQWNTTFTNVMAFKLSTSKIKSNGSMICDKFVVDNIKAGSGIEDIECVGKPEGSLLHFKILKSKLSTQDVAGFKAFLKANPVTLYYELAEPTTTQLEPINLKSYEGTTHIMSDNLLAPTISCKIPSNVPAVVSSLRIENESLTNEVETLALENETLKEISALQDEAINVNMVATDELYTTLDSIVNPVSTMSLFKETIQENKEVDSMVDFYVVMVQRGLKKVENVPERYREQVKAILEELEK